MFDDCIILDVRLGERLVFVRNFASTLPPSQRELRRMFEDLRDLESLAAVVRDVTGQRLDAWGEPPSREDQLDRAAELLAGSGCRVLTTGWRSAFTGRAPGGRRGEDLDSRIPMLSDLRPREPVQATAEYFVELEVVTDDGVPIADAQFEVKNTRGFAARCKSDASGRARTSVPLDELYGIRVLADIVLPPSPTAGEARLVKGITLGRLENETLEVSVNHRHVLVITRPRAKIVSIDRWVEARPVLVFGNMSQTDEGPTTVRGALRRAFTEGGAGELHVVGHADTEGKVGDNEALALERARSVHLYLAGDRAGWADHAFANADVATLQAALAWAAASGGLGCHPGPIDNDWGPATAAALDALRDHAGVDHSQQLGPDDWAAIFDLYDDDLGRLLLTDRDGVAAARAGLRLAGEPTTMGERWPVDAPELADHECPGNRRVDLVLCPPTVAPKPDSDELYDGTFVREHLVTRPEARFQLLVHSPALIGLGGAAADIEIGGLGSRRLRAGATGLVEFTVLRGDRVRVIGGRRADGGGTVREFGTPELGRFV